VLLSSTTQEQADAFWDKCKEWLRDAIAAGVIEKNESRRILLMPSTSGRIKVKTAWDADSLRGDYADFLVLDECALLAPDAWDKVGAPMLMDNDGDAWFISTPRRRDNWFFDLYQRAEADGERWKAFHFTSYDNPHLSKSALDEIATDLTRDAVRQEILAEFLSETLGALFTTSMINTARVYSAPELARIVVAIDPTTAATETSDETGMIVAGLGYNGHGYVLEDLSGRFSPDAWARRAIDAYRRHKADRIVAEKNNGQEMIEHTLRTVDPQIPYRGVVATRGKALRAEPVAALYEQGRVHHVGALDKLEDQMVSWTPADKYSPDRLDALVWALTDLMLGPGDMEPMDAATQALWRRR
jgi:predicted phage terminase large subunit-like protein